MASLPIHTSLVHSEGRSRRRTGACGVDGGDPRLEVTRKLLPQGGSWVKPTAATTSGLPGFRKRAGTVFHPCSTCRMGADPATSVVDARLRVHGLEDLRVIDASIFPNVTSSNRNAPAIMVGEKSADLVLEDAPGQ